MKFFIDTANLDEIKKGVEMGMVDGVTTNPSLIARESQPFEEIVAEICKLVDGPVSAEVVSLEADGMLAEAKELAKIADNIVIKIPMIVEGLKAVKQLTAEGIKTNVTLVFSCAQALLAAKAGATFVSPFVGRLDDIGTPSMDLISDIATVYDNYGYQSEIIVASVRSPQHVMDAALIGADIATIPLKVITQLAKHPLTDIGMGFLWARLDTASKKVGAPALHACVNQKGRMKLVGFKVGDTSVKPQDGDIIVDGEKIVGFACTTRFSDTLGWQYGMALVFDQHAVEGNEINLYQDLGQASDHYTAKVIPPHFYDPEGKRLRM